MQNQNLFALLPDDADDVYYIAAPNKAPAAEEKKKQLNDTTNKSKPDKNKTDNQGANVRSNGYHQSKNGNWGSQGYNRVADGSGSNYNGNYKGSSYQKNYNGEQRLHGAGGGNFPARGQGYGGRGRGNGRGRSFNEYSNGKQLDNLRKGNQSGEAESLNKPVTGAGKEAWQVVGRLSRASSVVSEGEVSYNPDQNGSYRRGNGDDSNANAVSHVSVEEDEERRIKRERWEKEMEEERKKKTLKQYYEEKEKEKERVVPKQPRIVALDKELEAMQLVGKKILPDSVSVTDMKSEKNKEKKENAGQKNVCKSIVEVLLKRSRFQPQRYNWGPNPKGNASNGFSDKGAPIKGNPSDKGFKDSHLKGKDTTVEGSNPKGTAALVVRSEDREAVESKVVKRAVHVNLKFDDATQFPALK